MSDELYKSRPFTQPGGCTAGIEGPGCDRHGNLYAVNYQRQGTIGKVTPDGTCSVFAELSSGSIGNGIRFHSEGYMLVADYTNHNVLRIDLDNREIEIYAHEPAMNQPNDLAIGVATITDTALESLFKQVDVAGGGEVDAEECARPQQVSPTLHVAS